MQLASDDESYDEACGDNENLFASDEELGDEELLDAEQKQDNIGDFLGSFKIHRLGVDGARRPERLARHIVLQVLSIHKRTSGDIGELTNVQNIRDKWLSKMMKERRPGIVKTYLSA